MNFSRFISAISKARKPSVIREATALLLASPPSVISLGAGSPNPCTFPFKSFKVETKDGNCIVLEGEDLSRALQYSQSSGIPELKSWLESLHKNYHDPPLLKQGNFDLSVTAGSQNGLAIAFAMLLSPGDNMLVDDPLYSGTLALLKPLPVNLLSVETDGCGLNPNSLLKALSRWKPEDAKNPASDIPKVLYTIPNCGNPTGGSASYDRKKEIYEIAQRYDLVIIEDDPYYFLQFNEDMVPSYQALDVDGRVIRCDSMSKILSSGMRLGWISGAKVFIDRIVLDLQASILHNSTMTQILALRLLEHWKLEGFEKHIRSVQKFYKSQCDVAISSANKWLTGIAEWNVPNGGMFLWVRIPEIANTKEMIKKRALEKEVILIPGEAFSVQDGIPSSYCRISYSLSTPEEIEEGIRRLSELIREEIG